MKRILTLVSLAITLFVVTSSCSNTVSEIKNGKFVSITTNRMSDIVKITIQEKDGDYKSLLKECGRLVRKTIYNNHKQLTVVEKYENGILLNKTYKSPKKNLSVTYYTNGKTKYRFIYNVLTNETLESKEYNPKGNLTLHETKEFNKNCSYNDTDDKMILCETYDTIANNIIEKETNDSLVKYEYNDLLANTIIQDSYDKIKKYNTVTKTTNGKLTEKYELVKGVKTYFDVFYGHKIQRTNKRGKNEYWEYNGTTLIKHIHYNGTYTIYEDDDTED